MAVIPDSSFSKQAWVFGTRPTSDFAQSIQFDPPASESVVGC